MGTVGVASWVAGAAERGEGANVRERQANGQPPEQPSYVAVEVPKGKAEGVVGGAGRALFRRRRRRRRRAGGRAARSGRGAFCVARGARLRRGAHGRAPRARERVRDGRGSGCEGLCDGSTARCALVVDRTGRCAAWRRRGVWRRSSPPAAATPRRRSRRATETCPWWRPRGRCGEAEARMRARRVTLAAVVATVPDASESGEEKRAALGVLEAGAAAAERDAAALGARAPRARSRRRERAERGEGAGRERASVGVGDGAGRIGFNPARGACIRDYLIHT